MVKPQRTQKVFETFAKKVIAESKSILKNKNISTTGELANSLGYEVKVFPSGALDLNFTAAEHFKYINDGVRGSSGKPHPTRGRLAQGSPYKYKSKMPPTRVIDKWTVKKGLKSVRDARGKFIPRKRLVYAIAKSIHLYGIDSTKFFTSPFNKHFKKLPQDIIKAYASDVTKFMTFATKDI